MPSYPLLTRVTSTWLKLNRRSYSTGIRTTVRDFAKGDPDWQLDPWYVTGLTDGEGSFGINVLKTETVLGFKFVLQFKVTQKADSAGILYDLQRYFGCGSVVIDNRRDGTLKFQVQDLKSIINNVIPHFDQYPLVTSKWLNYNDFKSVALMLSDGQHQTEVGVKTIQGIKMQMNKGRTYQAKWNYLNDALHLKLGTFKLNPYWVLGFIDGEATWYVEMGLRGANTRTNPYFAVVAALEIAQSSHDVFVLEAIGHFFGGGAIMNPTYDISSIDAAMSSRAVNRIKLRKPEPIIRFMNNHELLTRKALDYQDWKRLVDMKQAQVHLTKEGQQRMLAIKAGMNKGRQN